MKTKMSRLLMLGMAAFALVMMLTTMANAQEFKPYVGVDYQYTQLNDVTSGEDNLKSGNLHIGTKVHQNLGFEAGVSKSVAEVTAGSKVDLTVYNVDAIGYLPVTQKLDLLGTVGVTYTILDSNTVASENEYGYAVGTGVSYALTDKVAVRSLIRYEDTDLNTIGSNDGAFKYTVGANYSF